MNNSNPGQLLVGNESLKRVIRSIVLIGIGVYLGLFVYARVFGDRIIFQPPPPSYRDTDEVLKLPSGDLTISAMHLKNPQADYTILFSHGNAEDLGTLRPALEELRRIGFSVFAYDYRGYGTSHGSSSEDTAYQDIDAAYDHLTRVEGVPPNRIIAHGRSLGGAIAIDLASRKPLGGLIVESSFVSAYRVVTRFPIYPFDQFKSISKIGNVRCPILIMHGTRDEVISFWHGSKLFEAANEPKLSYWVEGARHNDLFRVAGPAYGHTLKRFNEMIVARGN